MIEVSEIEQTIIGIMRLIFIFVFGCDVHCKWDVDKKIYLDLRLNSLSQCNTSNF